MTALRSHPAALLALLKTLGCAGVMLLCAAAVAYASSPAPVTNPCATSGSACNINAGVFAAVVCFIESAVTCSTSVLFQSIATWVEAPLKAAITLTVIVFGLSFISGVIQLSAREFMVLMFKIGLVWTFATQSDYAIGVAHNFFIDFAKEGGQLVWEAARGASAGNALGGITSIDAQINSLTDAAASNSASGVMGRVDPICKQAIMSLVAFMALTMPFLFLVALFYLYSLIKLFAIALLFYFKSIILISFLIMLAPIFVSFALFKRTVELFETWLQMLSVNALQMLVMFAFFAMITVIDFGSVFAEFFNLLRVYKPLGNGWVSSILNSANSVKTFFGFGPLSIQTEFCSICYYNVSANFQNIYCVRNDAMPITALPFQINLFVWMVGKLVALMLVSYLLTDFLKKSGQLAEQLGGTRFSGILSGSASTPGFAGYSNPIFRGIESASLAFKNAYRQSMYRSGALSAITSLGHRLENPLNVFAKAKATYRGAGAVLGLSSAGLAANSWETDKISRQIKDYEKRAYDAQKAATRTGNILSNTLKQHQDGKVGRAALISAQAAHSLALKNAERWRKKFKEASDERNEIIRKDLQNSVFGKYTDEKGNVQYAGVFAQELARPIDSDYQRLIGRNLQESKTRRSFYFLPMDEAIPGSSADQEKLQVEIMQNYLQSQIDDVRKKMDSAGSNLSDYEKGRINQELNNAKASASSSSAEQIESAIDNLRSISNSLD